MPYSPKDICNLGLGRIAASLVSNLSPPVSALEKHCASGYGMWKRTELAKRRWVFAVTSAVLTQEGPALSGVLAEHAMGRAYRYPLPTDCVRPLHPSVNSPYQWKQEGRVLLSTNSTLVLTYVRDVPDSDLEDEFVDVLAWRIAMECVEFATQSNTKKEDCRQEYRAALAEAGKNNAFVLGSEASTGEDEAFSWLSSRWS